MRVTRIAATMMAFALVGLLAPAVGDPTPFGNGTAEAGEAESAARQYFVQSLERDDVVLTTPEPFPYDESSAAPKAKRPAST